MKNILSKITEKTEIESPENYEKAAMLEAQKPSLSEPILYFYEEDLEHIPEGFSQAIVFDTQIRSNIAKRSLLEHLPIQRHPIPYILIRYIDETQKTAPYFFFILREGGSTESRLVGKIGLPGGHVDGSDAVYDSNGTLQLKETIEKGLFRELYEEVGITQKDIQNIQFLGYIKEIEQYTVGADHLGLVYCIDVSHKNYDSKEAGVISGIWLQENEIDTSRLETWSKYIVESGLNTF